jgi:effector-binding domain-containing protein
MEVRMVRNIVIGVAAFIAVIVGVAFVLPQKVHVERSAVIAASPDQVFAVVNDLTRAKEWGPWYKRDPKMEISFEGPPAGIGAKLKWNSASEGEGSQEIVESEPFKVIKTKLDFGAQGKADAAFLFTTVEGGTKVTWSMDTDVGMNPVARYMGLMFDSWIGKDYEEGLANLKQLVEAQAQSATDAALASPGGAAPPDIPMAAAADPNKGPEILTVEARPTTLTRSKAKASDGEAISASLGAAYQQLLNYGMANNLNVAGAPLAITISHTPEGDWVFDAAMPLEAKPDAAVAEADGVKIGQSYAGRVVKLTHKGPYNTMAPAYERLHAYTKANNLKEKPIAWEEYVSDPGETADSELLTNVYVAIE